MSDAPTRKSTKSKATASKPRARRTTTAAKRTTSTSTGRAPARRTTATSTGRAPARRTTATTGRASARRTTSTSSGRSPARRTTATTERAPARRTTARASEPSSGRSRSRSSSNAAPPATDSSSAAAVEPLPGLSKCGGYAEEIFTDLTETEIEQFTCNICLMVVREGRQCKQGHKYCKECINAWREERSKNDLLPTCPTCRQPGRYSVCKGNRALQARTVQCPVQRCTWTGHLKDLAGHMESPACPGSAES